MPAMMGDGGVGDAVGVDEGIGGIISAVVEADEELGAVGFDGEGGLPLVVRGCVVVDAVGSGPGLAGVGGLGEEDVSAGGCGFVGVDDVEIAGEGVHDGLGVGEGLERQSEIGGRTLGRADEPADSRRNDRECGYGDQWREGRALISGFDQGDFAGAGGPVVPEVENGMVRADDDVRTVEAGAVALRLTEVKLAPPLVEQLKVIPLGGPTVR